MFDHSTNDAVSRRNVLTTTSGLIAGSTVLAGLGAGRGAAETEEGLRVEVREMNEESIGVEVVVPEAVYSNDVDFPTDTYLGHAERFVSHEDGEWVSLPEDTDGLANPVHFERVNERGAWPKRYLMSFRTRDLFSKITWEPGEEVTVGLGLFTERTVPHSYFDACPGHRDY